MTNVDYSGLEIAQEEMRGCFRDRARAGLVLENIRDGYGCPLTLSPIRHRPAIIGHVERLFRIITVNMASRSMPPITCTGTMHRDHARKAGSDD